DQPAHRGEVRMRDAHGGARWMLLSARRCDDAAGRFAGVTGTMTDISREKAAEATLARACAAAETAGRAKSEFLSAMGHELRTPLNAVIGLSESLLEASAAADPERARRYLGLIHASGRQLLTQVNDLVDLARIEAGQVRPLLVAVDLGAMVALAAEGQQRDARTRGIEFVVTPPASPVTARVDERLMRRVCQALIANAVKVTRPKGRVDVAVRTSAAGRVEFTVCDAGSGLLTDLQSPRQATTAGTNVRQLNGTDLVLALADRVARLHGGILTVESIAGQGSAVAIDLPAAGNAPAANPISP
ncbi:MAG: HAMP domain-containing sensor histidine kinase, partial [Verrucomicrobia bacterium]|nr:HAMP domain-containing sensor histidine kinase [Verrucomicrobiota bacterium]